MWGIHQTQISIKEGFEQGHISLTNCFERSWLLGNNRKLHFCLTLSVNCKIVYFEHLNKLLRTICVLIDTCFD